MSHIPSICLFNYKYDITLSKKPSDNATKNNIFRNAQMCRCNKIDFWTDDDCTRHLSIYNSQLGRDFRMEKDGRLKSDLCRLHMVWRFGGVYMDNDLYLLKNPLTFMTSQINFMSLKAATAPGIFQALIVSIRGHPVLPIAMHRHQKWYEHKHLRTPHAHLEVWRITRLFGPRKPNIGTVLLLDAIKEYKGESWVKRLWKKGILDDMKLLAEEPVPRTTACHCRPQHLCNFVGVNAPYSDEMILMSRFRTESVKHGVETCRVPTTCASCEKQVALFVAETLAKRKGLGKRKGRGLCLLRNVHGDLMTC